MYCLRIVTNEEKQRFLGFPGIDLKVTELRVEIPEEIIEGQSPVLFCKTTCNLSYKTNFTWYKNGKHLSESVGSNQLLLPSVSSDDTGNYSCAVTDQKHLPSPAVTLSVRCGQKTEPSGKVLYIVAGIGAALICICVIIVVKKIMSLSNVTHEDKGMYCLRIVTNEEKQRFLGFPGIDLKVTELRVEIPEEIIEGQSPVLFCKTTCNLSYKTNFTWYKNGKHLSESVGSNQLLLPSVSSDDTGNYSCAVTDQKHLPSPAVTLSVRSLIFFILAFIHILQHVLCRF
ncbi:B-cell receptor CD22-like protein [Labeo rohita]|uniref:B-cell receptor CD22-like protein n=1 Tax=Labeo rohita TaxID=84645 RepID=A0A498LCD1_LABRO|nr:B-cell receptor CD22-like protein [Labeo rohita]